MYLINRNRMCLVWSDFRAKQVERTRMLLQIFTSVKIGLFTLFYQLQFIIYILADIRTHDLLFLSRRRYLDAERVCKSLQSVGFRVVRWIVFKPKLPIWVNFIGSCNGSCCYILWPFGIFYGHLVYFVAIWCILLLFGIFFPFWYVVPRKIWQPWLASRKPNLVN
jgi:hypothetical protein